MSAVLSAWEQPVKIKTITRTTLNFAAVDVVTSRNQLCVVQVADKSKLNAETIDWALKYILIHSKQDLALSEVVEFSGEDYKIIERGQWTQYGYVEAIAEQTKRPLLTDTPIPPP